jgi:hypothetical protein
LALLDRGEDGQEPLPRRPHAENRDAVPTEVERLVALGATVIRDPKEEYGAYWATLQDPEGNEFCLGRVLRIMAHASRLLPPPACG